MSETLPIRKDWLEPVPFNIWTGKDPKSGEYENIMPYGRYFTEIMHWINDVEKEVIYLDDDGAECTIEPTKWYRYLSEKKKEPMVPTNDALDGHPLFDNYVSDIGKAIRRLHDIFEGKGETEGADWPALVTPQGKLYDKNIQALREGLLGIDYMCFGYVGESSVYRFEWWPRFLNTEEMIRVQGSLLDENYEKINYLPYPECGILQYFNKYLIREPCYYDDGNPVYSIIFDYLYNDVEKTTYYVYGQNKDCYYCCRADEHKVYRYDEKGVFNDKFVVKRLIKDEGWQEYTAFKVSHITGIRKGGCSLLSTSKKKLGVFLLYDRGSTKEFQLVVDCDLSAQGINFDSIKNVSASTYKPPLYPWGNPSPDECAGSSVWLSFIDGNTKFNYGIYPSVVVDKHYLSCSNYGYFPKMVRMKFPTSVNSDSLTIKGLVSGNSLDITKGKKTVGVSYAYTATRSERTFRKWEKFKEKEIDGMFSTWTVNLFRPYAGYITGGSDYQYWDEDTGEELDPPIFISGWKRISNMVTIGLALYPIRFKDKDDKKVLVVTSSWGESGGWTYSAGWGVSSGVPRVYNRNFYFTTTNEKAFGKGIHFGENQDYDYLEEQDWITRESIKVSGEPSLSDYNGARAFIETSYPIKKTGDIFLMGPPLSFTITPSGGQITLGETKQFTAYGRVPPYTWEVSDPTIARITDKGTNNVEVTVKGRKVGKFYLRVTDSVGQKGCSKWLSVVE